MPQPDQLQIEEPQLVKQGGKYSVKLKAHAPAIHLLKTGVEAVVTPSIGGDGASEEIISFLLQGFDGDHEQALGVKYIRPAAVRYCAECDIRTLNESSAERKS